ncbi:hypothetical protein PTI98_012768 [Pleurotus ostreatus]|nr:hypothetical protein PTI98_012768 [Pleurotus ostreatus]
MEELERKNQDALLSPVHHVLYPSKSGDRTRSPLECTTSNGTHICTKWLLSCRGITQALRRIVRYQVFRPNSSRVPRSNPWIVQHPAVD